MKDNQLTIEKLEHHLNFFQGLYDIVRIVDPVDKSVFDYRQNALSKTCEKCFNYWKYSKICDNCISIRAYHENRSFVKIEQSPDVIMLVIALPIIYDGPPHDTGAS